MIIHAGKREEEEENTQSNHLNFLFLLVKIIIIMNSEGEPVSQTMNFIQFAFVCLYKGNRSGEIRSVTLAEHVSPLH